MDLSARWAGYGARDAARERPGSATAQAVLKHGWRRRDPPTSRVRSSAAVRRRPGMRVVLPGRSQPGDAQHAHGHTERSAPRSRADGGPARATRPARSRASRSPRRSRPGAGNANPRRASPCAAAGSAGTSQKRVIVTASAGANRVRGRPSPLSAMSQVPVEHPPGRQPPAEASGQARRRRYRGGAGQHPARPGAADGRARDAGDKDRLKALVEGRDGAPLVTSGRSGSLQIEAQLDSPERRKRRICGLRTMGAAGFGPATSRV